MYSKTLEPKINQMFSEINNKVSVIIESSPSKQVAYERIAQFVASETVARSKTMLSDMYSALSKQTLNSIGDVTLQNRFYEANLRQEIFDKYNFSVPEGEIDFDEANRIFAPLAAGAGTMGVGGLLIYALKPAAIAIPIALVVAASISVFCLAYFKATPNADKSNFNVAIAKYLSEIKASYLAWFMEVERYFYKRAEEIKRSF